ncbi:hypothetical protein ACGFWE_13870 [Streptomyces sp. NPDC048523]|uniref:hypothetical protein n=1 Tax=Streptomyces sp. NPDC048523 TaxID=3365567 RepID=UPI0037178C94
MRVRLTDGTREVEIKTDGTADDAPLLRQIERTARRLLDAMPAPHHAAPQRFGFGRDLDRIALDSVAERADPEPDFEDEGDDECRTR